MKPYFRKAGNPASQRTLGLRSRENAFPVVLLATARGLRDHESAAGDFLRQCGSGRPDRRSARAGHRGRAARCVSRCPANCSGWRRRGVPA